MICIIHKSFSPNHVAYITHNPDCQDRIKEGRYALGYEPPNYQLPAIPTRVGYMPAHHTQPFPSAYWYVAGPYLLWSCFEKYGLIVERQ